MDKTVLAFIEKLEVFKTKIKALHWDSDSLSQHKLCDEIAESIAEFQDQVSEVEQSISGKLGKNLFRPDNQEFGEIGSLKEFVNSVIEHTNTFYKELQNKGDKYIGMRSDCESFLSDMQRKLYLVNFTMKEDMKRRITKMVNESRPKNLANVDGVDKFIGRRPTTMKARINQIYRIVKNYGIDSRVYHDDHWQAKDDYYKAITSLGCEFEMRPCADSNRLDDWDYITSDGGYTDYDPEDHMPRSKQYAVKIMFDDGMNIGGYIKFMAAGSVEDPFSAYDTCMILWPKNNRTLGENKNNFMDNWEEEHLDKVRKELRNKAQEDFYQRHPDFRGNGGRVEESRLLSFTESELKNVLREAVTRVLEDLSIPEREKRMQNQISWNDMDKEEYDDFDNISDLIDKGKQYQAHTQDLHKANPERWRRMTGR